MGILQCEKASKFDNIRENLVEFRGEKGHFPSVIIRHSSVNLFNFYFQGINTNLRRIDLICKLFAPLFITLIMHFAGLLAATIVLAAWNILSFIVETILINFVYNLEPNLATKEYRHKDDTSEDNTRVVNSNNSNNAEENEDGFNQGLEDTSEEGIFNQEV